MDTTIHVQANHGRTMLSGRCDPKQDSKKCSTSGNVQIPCAINQTRPNKCYKSNCKHQSWSQRKWYARILDFLHYNKVTVVWSHSIALPLILSLSRSYEHHREEWRGRRQRQQENRHVVFSEKSELLSRDSNVLWGTRILEKADHKCKRKTIFPNLRTILISLSGLHTVSFSHGYRQ